MPRTPEQSPEEEPGWFKTGMGTLFTLRAGDVLVYRIADDAGGWLILPMVVFSPWAFGTVQPWSIHLMTAGGLVLGALLLIKVFIRRAKGYPAPRWDLYSPRTGTLSRQPHRPTQLVTRALAILTVAVLAYCAISALNVAANYNDQTRLFEYHHYLSWLPHSLDGWRTWSYFWNYLGLAGTFWAVWDWLAGMTASEERTVFGGSRTSGRAPQFPARLGLLLWVLCVNGAVIGLEGIVQRLSGTDKLLWVKATIFQPTGETQFGPYAYRSNAAQYFNLLWPVCLGFWLTLQRLAHGRSRKHFWLLGCAAIMAACPIISASRAGAIVSVSMMTIAFIYLGLTSRQSSPPEEATLVFQKGRRSRLEKTPPESGAAGGELESQAEARQGNEPESAAPATAVAPGLPAKSSPPSAAPDAGHGNFGWLFLFLIISLGLGWFFGWNALFPRLQQIGEGYAGRAEMYEAARPMVRDYPWFGTGPGTFGTVFQLYRYSEDVFWAEQLHNDWLETRITFGLWGLTLLLAALATVAIRWFTPGGIRGHRRLAMLAWLSLAGCLLTARYDFPFQVHSTLLLFLLVCAMLFNLSRSSGSSRR